MAKGDRLYLADKDSVDTIGTKVDDVKTVLDNTKTSVETVKSTTSTTNTNVTSINTKVGATSDASGTSSIFSYLKNILEKLTTLVTASAGTSRSTEYVLPGEFSKYVVTGSKTIPLGTSSTELLRVTGSGTLYSVAVNFKGASASGITENNTQLTVEVDGKTVYNNSERYTSNTQRWGGFVSRPATLGLYSGTDLILATGERINTGVSSSSGGTAIEVSPLTGSVSYDPLVYSDLPVKFSSSLVIKGYSTNLAGSFNVYYRLD